MKAFSRAHLKELDALVRIALARSRGAGAGLPGLVPLFVDPSNVTGFASDSNTGQTSTNIPAGSGPIRTTAHLNTLLVERTISVPTTIRYLSDDPSGTELDLSSVDVAAPGSLSFVGTPQVLHVGGTLNAGTIAINPATPPNGQRQTAHTTDLAAFAPFVQVSLGGTAAHPTYLLATSGPDAGSSAWIVSGLGATASLSRPMDPTFATPGSLTIGDSYNIQRGSTLAVGGALTLDPNAAAILSFTDFAFSFFNVVTPGSFSPACLRCSFDDSLLAGVDLLHCFSNDMSFNTTGFFFSAGVWILAGNNTSDTLVEVTNDVYVTDTPATPAPFICDANVHGNVTVFSSLGSPASGMQIHDTHSTIGGMLIANAPPVLTGINGPGLIWGSGNGGVGIALAPNAGATVPATAGAVPSIGGTAGEFAFEAQNGGALVQVARAFDDSVGAYTEAGGPATRTTTWAHFVAALGAGGFAFQAHSPATGASIVGL